MSDLTTATPLPALISRASEALLSAKTSAEVLEAKDIAGVAYQAAKSAGRIAKAKKAHEDVMSAVYRAQADALLIEARAKMRLADEYDAAQERGEVAKNGDNLTRITKGNSKATMADIGLNGKDVHEARKLRDAEKNDPGVTERAINEMVDRGEEPTKAKLKKGLHLVAAKEPETFDLKVDPVEAKLKKEFRALTDEAREEAYVGLSLELRDAKKEKRELADEVRRLKDQINGFTGEQAETIRRLHKQLRHKESEMYRANDKADKAMARAKRFEKRVAELEAMEITL